MPMITIHHAQGSRSTRVVWLCEELGLDYELKHYRMGSPELRSTAFRALHPLARVPVIECEGTVLFESLAILQWLLERYGAGRLEPPVGDPARAAYLQWLHFSEGTAIVPVGEYLGAAVMTPEEKRNPAAIASAQKRIGRVHDLLEAELGQRDFIVGTGFSAADIALGYTCFLARMVGQLGDAHPRVVAYVDRLAERPAFQRATSA